MQNFGDLPSEFCNYNSSSIALLPVPYDGTSTWIKGADKGPFAILDASANMELYDIPTNSEVYRNGIHTLDPLVHHGDPEKLSVLVKERVMGILKDKKFPVVLGGEHSVSIGCFLAAAEFFTPVPGILQLDAHTDLREEYLGSSYNHACVMARARETAPILQVGIRSMDKSELESTDLSRVYFAHDIRKNFHWIQDITSRLEENTWITLDLDVLDPSIMPATGTPEPGGLDYYSVLDLIESVCKKTRVIGLDLVELCPNENSRPSEFLAAKLLYQILSLIFKYNRNF